MALALAVGTALCLGKKPLSGQKALLALAGAWVVFAAVRFLPNGPTSALIRTALDWLALSALSAALTVTLRWVRGRRAEEPKEQ